MNEKEPVFLGKALYVDNINHYLYCETVLKPVDSVLEENECLMGRWDIRAVLSRIFRSALQKMIGTITHISTDDTVAALTFDDGPDPRFTPRLLEILESYGTKAAFFMVGENANRYPELVRRVAQAGHAIGNHSWDHTSFRLIAGRERRAQIRACESAIAPYGQKLFRPPYGHQSIASRLDALWLGYQVVTWNVIAYDWLDRDADRLVYQIVSKIQPGSVILFHDALHDIIEDNYADREPMLEAVNMLLERLGDHFRLVTIPELFQHGHPQRQNWYMKADVDFLNSLRVQEGEARRYAHGNRCQ
ncbi:MAG: polysaccharide deacetylase family protein [Chloroflexi bacterium]|nr:polysaccharide deacetylase family protein [Chloroflexota bacterium]